MSIFHVKTLGPINIKTSQALGFLFTPALPPAYIIAQILRLMVHTAATQERIKVRINNPYENKIDSINNCAADSQRSRSFNA